jgi:hypothetical protein
MTSVRRWAPACSVALAAAGAWGAFLGGGFRSIIGWFALMTVVPLLALVVGLVAAIVAIRRRRLGAAIASTLGVCMVAFWPVAWNLQLLTVTYPFSLSTSKPAATVRLPLEDRVRVAWGGDDLAHNHHASAPDQRWAYDLTVEPAFTRSPNLQDYGCYGKDVVAPAAGEIWVAHDGEPEQPPGALSANFRAPLGNMVAIRLETGTFLILGHLQKGSVAAQVGAHVEEGQVIGRCGNTGNTSEPHVHVHHQRQDPRQYPIGFAEGLPLYFRDHDGAAMPQGGLAVRGDAVTPIGDVIRHVGLKRAEAGRLR